jgi:hypothetical protein
VSNRVVIMNIASASIEEWKAANFTAIITARSCSIPEPSILTESILVYLIPPADGGVNAVRSYFRIGELLESSSERVILIISLAS